MLLQLFVVLSSTLPSTNTELMKNPVDGFSVGLADDSDVYAWNVMMEGPCDTP